jgi:hypothetical protein
MNPVHMGCSSVMYCRTLNTHLDLLAQAQTRVALGLDVSNMMSFKIIRLASTPKDREEHDNDKTTKKTINPKRIP